MEHPPKVVGQHTTAQNAAAHATPPHKWPRPPGGGMHFAPGWRSRGAPPASFRTRARLCVLTVLPTTTRIGVGLNPLHGFASVSSSRSPPERATRPGYPLVHRMGTTPNISLFVAAGLLGCGGVPRPRVADYVRGPTVTREATAAAAC